MFATKSKYRYLLVLLFYTSVFRLSIIILLRRRRLKSTYRWMVRGEDKEAPIRWLEDICTGDERWRDERKRVERRGD